MKKLPKIVASKLAQGTGALPPSAVSHPDPDLLTAFVECSLPEWERVQVVGHLAGCTRCRDVVALAQPELVTSSPAFIPKPLVSGGFWLRWGALAACAVLAVTLVLRHSNKEEKPSVVATKRADESAAIPARASNVAPSASVASARAESRVAPSPSQPAAKTASPLALSSRLSKQKALDLKARMRQSDDQPHLEVQRDEPGAPETALGKGQAPLGGLNAESAKVAAPALLADKKAEAMRSDQLTAANTDARQKEAYSYSGVAGGGTFGATNQTAEVASAAQAVGTEKDNDVKEELHASSAPIEGNLRLARKAVRQAALWQITTAGELQRSYDSGKSWESVSLGQPVRLRVMAMSGLHVWAAGNGGKLFHSWDGGANFAAVAVKDAYAILTGDIVVLEFADSLQGRLEAAGHEVWATSDGGKSWRKQ